MIERAIVDAAARLRRNREPHLVATVVRVCGAAYRKPGARMLLTHFRWITSAISGGCLAGDIAKEAWARTQNGEPQLLTYDSAADSDDDIRSAFGLGCDGAVEVLIERAGAPGRLDPLAFASECLRTQRRGALVTVIRSRVPEIRIGTRVALQHGGEPVADPLADEILTTAMIADARAALASGESCQRSYTSARGSVDVFVEAILPPPRLFVFGTGHDALPLVQLAHGLGWDVTVCTNEARASTQQRFSHADEVLVGTPAEHATRLAECDRAVAIVMSHRYETDRDDVGMLIGSRARYIGVLGPRARTTRMLAELGVEDDPRVHAPVGLELGAETPHEIALAIVAQIQTVLHRAGPDRIADRPMPRITEAVAAALPVAS